MKMLFFVFITFFIVLQLAIRFAPADRADWHKFDRQVQTGDGGIHITAEQGGALAMRIADDPDVLEKLTEIALKTPRTRIFAGSVDEGMITFETRSAFWGFPDYTTVKLLPESLVKGMDGQTLLIHARLRFGKKDFGVNKRRVNGWMKALE